MFCQAGLCTFVHGAGCSLGFPVMQLCLLPTLPGALRCCCPPANPASSTWGNWAPTLGMLRKGELEAELPGLGSVAGSPGFLQAFCKQEPLAAAVPSSTGCRNLEARPTAATPCAGLPASCHSAATRLCCLCPQSFLPALETAFQCLMDELIFSGSCTRHSLPISTCTSCSVPAGAGPHRLGTLVLVAAMPPVCGASREPPRRQKALQKHSFSDCNKLVDFAHLAEIREMKKLLMRMTDGGPNNQTV